MIRSINNSSKDYVLEINGITWKKNYEELFDYDEHINENLISFNQEVTVRDMFFLIWKNKKTFELNVETKKELRKIKEKELDPHLELLCGGKATIKNKIFNIRLYQADEIIKEPEQENISTSIYYNEHHIVVRSLKNEEKEPIGFELKSNNLIKLGNFEFFVHLVSVDNEDDRSLELMASSLNLNKKETNESFLKEVTFFINNNQKVYDANAEEISPEAECKYCMMNESDQEGDFLCSPCKCSGSCGLVHFGCLVKWNKNKVKKTKNKGCVEYDFEKFFCEVCKLEYPQYIKKNQKVYEILPMEKPKSDFIVMEALNSLKRHIIIVEDLSEEGLVIGRGQDCGLRLDDSTISRRHSLIKRVKDKFLLFDLKSKFGTLVRDISFNYQLLKGDKFSIQSGGTVLSFSLAKKSNETLLRS